MPLFCSYSALSINRSVFIETSSKKERWEELRASYKTFYFEKDIEGFTNYITNLIQCFNGFIYELLLMSINICWNIYPVSFRKDIALVCSLEAKF